MADHNQSAMPCAHYTDAQIIDMHSRFLAGDTVIGWELVLSKLPLIKKVCARRMGYCGAELEDLVQEYMLTVFQSLGSFNPDDCNLNLFICRAIEDGPNRILRTCRRMAGLPLSSEACHEFSRKPEEAIHDAVRDSDYQYVIDLVEEANEAIEMAELGNDAVMALDLIAHGKNRQEIRKSLESEFGEQYPRAKLEKLIDGSIAKLQEVLGTTGTERSLSHREVSQSNAELILREALTKDFSPQKLSKALLTQGIRVSYGYTYRLYKDHDIYLRRAKIQAGEPLLGHVAEILAEQAEAREKPKPTVALPKFTELTDEQWERIEHLIPDSGSRANPRLNTSVVVYRAQNGNIPFKKLPPTGIHWDVAWRWEKKLKQIGVYAEVLSVACPP